MARKKTRNSDIIDHGEFKIGDLVGAKVKGFPLWPGQIESIDPLNIRRKYTVRFFYSNDTSQTFTTIKYFDEFTEQDKKCVRKGFQEALKLCQIEQEKTTGRNRSKVTRHKPDATEIKVEPSIVDDLKADNIVNSGPVSEVDDDDDDDVDLPPMSIDLNATNTRSRSSKKVPVLEHKQQNSGEAKIKIEEKANDSEDSLPALQIEHMTPKTVHRTKRRLPDDSTKPKEKSARLSRRVRADSPSEPSNNDSNAGKTSTTINKLTHNVNTTSDNNFEGEKVMISSNRQVTIEKLKGKVAKKLEEKAHLKDKKKKDKELEKAIQKLPLVYDVLQHVSEISQKFRTSKSNNPHDNNMLCSAINKYESILPILNKSIRLLGLDLIDKECKNCQSKLNEVIQNLKDAKSNGVITQSMKKQIKECLSRTFGQDYVVKLVGEKFNVKDSLMDRKENDAKHKKCT